MIVELFILIAFVLVLVFPYFFNEKEYNVKAIKMFSYVVSLFGFLLVLAVILYNNSTVYSEYSIVSLSMESEISGSFFLGIGSINSRQVYYAYKAYGEGVFKLIELPIVKIRETNEISPRYINKLICSGERTITNWYLKCYKINEIVVPKGTIVREFRV